MSDGNRRQCMSMGDHENKRQTSLVGYLELQLLDVRAKHVARFAREGQICSQGCSVALDVPCLVPGAGIEDGGVNPSGGCDTQESEESEGFGQDRHWRVERLGMGLYIAVSSEGFHD